MNIQFLAFVFAGLISAVAATAQSASVSDIAAMQAADVVILGEYHDNPAQHVNQAEIVKTISPRAVVWEMLSEEAGDLVTAELIENPENMARELGWAGSGWPDFAMYHPIFHSSSEAAHYGAMLARDVARAAVGAGAAQGFGADAARYGLTEALDDDEQSTREALQQQAHCNALPVQSLAPMVDIQRLRDAVLARAVIRAMDETGGPVAVITGNGHARRDWGIPSYLARVRPDLQVFSLGQSEAGNIDGVFDAVIDTAPAERGDPCEAFRPPAPPGETGAQ